MKISNLILILFVTGLFLGCSTSEPEIDFEKPEIQIPKKSPEPRKIKVLYILFKELLFC